MKVYTLGTSHGATEPGRSCSGNLLEVNGSFYLFDCGGSVEGKMTDLGLPIKNIRCVFISHMHEDHVGTLSAIAKRFTTYIKTGEQVQIYLPEEQGIRAFIQWLKAMHFPKLEKLCLKPMAPGVLYADENITVRAISTAHMQGGVFPSYAFAVEAEGKKFLYTGDLAADFHDYPQILFEEEFDAVLCELVHFDPEKNLDTILKTKTKKLLFTHLSPRKISFIRSVEERFPFPVQIAEDNGMFSV